MTLSFYIRQESSLTNQKKEKNETQGRREEIREIRTEVGEIKRGNKRPKSIKQKVASMT